MIKFAIKAGLASAAVYCTVEQGVWKDSDTTSKLYETMKTHACPIINEATSKIPYELPSLPNAENGMQMGRVYWNTGVKNVFSFLIDLPAYIKKWSSSAYDSFESFANSPTTPEVTNEKQ